MTAKTPSTPPRTVEFSADEVRAAFRFADRVYTLSGARFVTGAARALIVRVCPVVRAVTGKPLPVCPSC